MELLKFVAKKNGVPNTFTSALLMEEIPEKHFKQSLPVIKRKQNNKNGKRMISRNA